VEVLRVVVNVISSGGLCRMGDVVEKCILRGGKAGLDACMRSSTRVSGWVSGLCDETPQYRTWVKHVKTWGENSACNFCRLSSNLWVDMCNRSSLNE
jgi:hypothetical protein